MPRRASLTLTLREFILRNILECLVCMDVMRQQIFSCVNGHAVCGRCKIQLKACPVCRTAFTTRCRNLEELSERMEQIPATPSGPVAAGKLQEIAATLGMSPRTMRVALVAAGAYEAASPLGAAALPTPGLSTRASHQRLSAPPSPNPFSAALSSGRPRRTAATAGLDGQFYRCLLCADCARTLPFLLAHIRSVHIQNVTTFGEKTLNFRRGSRDVYPIIENNKLFWLYKSQGNGWAYRALKMAAPKHIADTYAFCIEVSVNNGGNLRFRGKVYSENDDVFTEIETVNCALFRKIVELSDCKDGKITCSLFVDPDP